MESDVDRPTFTPCQTADNLEFCVIIEWPNGGETRINHFGTWEAAKQWIARESANWTRMHPQTKPRPLSESESKIIPRPVRTQILQAA
jgi:hypothetical protein